MEPTESKADFDTQEEYLGEICFILTDLTFLSFVEYHRFRVFHMY